MRTENQLYKNPNITQLETSHFLCKSTIIKMKLRSQQYYSMMAFAVLTVILLFANAFVTTYIVLTLKLYKVIHT